MSKSPDAFRTISEVADDLELPQHVLRFWETRFLQIKPMKRGGGRRYYRPDDVDLLRGIKTLLYDEGYTIRGVQRLLKEQGNKLAQEVGRTEVPEVILGATGTHAAYAAEIAPQEAVNVEALAEKGSDSNSSILGKLSKMAGLGDDEPLTVSQESKKILEATLQDLLECKRLLDQTRQE